MAKRPLSEAAKGAAAGERESTRPDLSREGVLRCRFVAEASFDGTGFSGWQIQAAGNTVQNALEECLTRVLYPPKWNRAAENAMMPQGHVCRVAGCGRTDAGVHARSYVFHFDVEATQAASTFLADQVWRGGEEASDPMDSLAFDRIPFLCVAAQALALLPDPPPDTLLASRLKASADRSADAILRMMASKPAGDNKARKHNHGLPPGVEILAISPAPSNSWHARDECTGKRYEYRVIEGHGDVFANRYAWALGRRRGPLDVAAMQSAASMLIGTHNFSTFGEISEGDPRSPIKTVAHLTVERQASLAQQGGGTYSLPQSDSVVTISCECDRFLYHMMRFISGTLVEVGLGRLSLEQFRAMRDSWDDGTARLRQLRALAPACGLTLREVFYADSMPFSHT